MKEFYTAIGNDLGTAQALALVWERLPTLNKATLREADKILGLGLTDGRPTQKLTIKQEELPEDIKQLVLERESARTDRDFAAADELRVQLEAAGYSVTDTPEGQKIVKN